MSNQPPEHEEPETKTCNECGARLPIQAQECDECGAAYSCAFGEDEIIELPESTFY